MWYFLNVRNFKYLTNLKWNEINDDEKQRNSSKSSWSSLCVVSSWNFNRFSHFYPIGYFNELIHVTKININTYLVFLHGTCECF